MATPKFSVVSAYAPKSGDYLLLPYCGKKAVFDPSLLPSDIEDAASPPGEKGGSRTVFAGETGGANLLARAVRLDAEYSDPQADLRKAVAEACKAASKEKCRRLVVFPSDDLLPAAQEGALLGAYVFDAYLSKKEKPLPVVAVAKGWGRAARKRLLAQRATLCDCVNFARDVLNEPPNEMNPPILANAFEKMGKKSGLKVTVWDDKRLKRERCGGILGVGQGAKAKPRLVIGSYAPRGAKKHICLVGKGITFDTGGYCLKPADGQQDMKYDMGGAAMMFAAACAIAALKLPIRVTVLTPLAENDISGEAYLTTSVLTTRTGRTIEVRNTDAEGRLILADALALAVERNPDCIVDSATLTGACVMALGPDLAGVFGTDRALTRSLIDAGEAEGEGFWELPLYGPYTEQLKTTIADCKNTGDGRLGGAITAALFLKQWVPDGVKWVHCDIAGPATKEKPLGHLGDGAKGFGVKTIVALAREMVGKG